MDKLHHTQTINPFSVYTNSPVYVRLIYSKTHIVIGFMHFCGLIGTMDFNGDSSLKQNNKKNP